MRLERAKPILDKGAGQISEEFSFQWHSKLQLHISSELIREKHLFKVDISVFRKQIHKSVNKNLRLLGNLPLVIHVFLLPNLIFQNGQNTGDVSIIHLLNKLQKLGH